MTQPAPEQALARAHQLLTADHPREAERLAREVLAAEPGSAEALEVLAHALGDQGRHREALVVARDAAAADPGRLPPRLLLVDALLHVRRPGEAHEVALTVVEQHPHAWQAIYTLGRTHLAQGLGQTRLALGAAQEAIRLAPGEPDPFNLAGICHRELREYDAARQAFEAALRVDPQHSLALGNLAAFDLQGLKVRAGGEKLTRAMAANPNSRLVQKQFARQVTRLALWFFLLALLGLFVTFALALRPWWVHALAAALFVAAEVVLAVHVCRALPASPRAWLPVIWRLSSWVTRAVLVAGVLLVVAMLGMGFATWSPPPPG